MGMMGARTADFVCPECTSKQLAKVMELTPSGQDIKTLRCAACKTVWHPCSEQEEHQDHDPDHTPG